jgi:hypothetical protein
MRKTEPQRPAREYHSKCAHRSGRGGAIDNRLRNGRHKALTFTLPIAATALWPEGHEHRSRPATVVLIPATTLRVVAWLAIHPAWWFLGDAIDYVNSAVNLAPGGFRPTGYSLILLAPLSHFQRLSLVTSAQHLLGLGSAILVYALLVRYGLASWLAALATVPMLFDGYVLASEQMLVSEPLFVTLVVAAVVLLLWPAERPSLVSSVLAGGLLGLAVITRTIALVLVCVVAVVLLPRASWSRMLALLIACLLPVSLYAVWFQQTYHQLNLTSSTGIFLYGRASKFADCNRISFPDPELARLCPTDPLGQRNENFYDFNPKSPLYRFNPSLVAADAEAARFAVAAIRSQPDDYAALVWHDLTQYFGLDDSGMVPFIYRFRTNLPMDDQARAAGRAYQGGRDPTPQYRPPLVRALADYQRFAVAPGLSYLVALVIAALGFLLGRDPSHGRLKTAIAITAATGLALLVTPSFTVPADVRYRLPALPLLGIAVTLGSRLLVEAWSLHRAHGGGHHSAGWKQRSTRDRLGPKP